MKRRPTRLSAAMILTLIALTLLALPTRTLPPNQAAGAAHLYLPLVQADPPARVLRIVDGDTIEVQAGDQRSRLRYIGIDTPERGEAYFSEASEANRQLVGGQAVRLERDVSDVDRWGRLLRYVYREDGTFVNEELVCQGWARAANYPPDERYRDRFARCEREARAAGLGIWAAPQPTPAPTAPIPTPTAPPPGDVVIRYIHYDGLVPYVESDEYAEIANLGEETVNLAGWRLNAGDSGQDFYFPSFPFQPGQACRIYTDEIHPESCGFSYEHGTALWNNDGECGHLFDAGGTEVSRYCYGLEPE